MTIKQHGGIFGRNPTFNTVSINDEIASSSLDVSGSASIDGPALIGTGTAEAGLHVDQNVGGIFTRLKRLSSQYIDTIMTSGVNQLYSYGKTFQIGTGDSQQVVIRQNNFSRMTFETDGNVTIENGNLILGTSGKGIDFSATSGTGTSELFDDYEEGTWTPQLLTDAGSSAGKSYSVQNGVYTKIGQTVIAHFEVAFDGTSGAKGSNNLNEAHIEGFPFAMKSSTPMGGFISKYNDTGVNVNTITLQPVSSGLTKAYFWISSSAGTTTSLAIHTLYTDSTRMHGVAIYDAA